MRFKPDDARFRPDDAKKKDNHTNLSGFRHEANAFFGWLGQNGITNFMTFGGDRHWQYHSIHPCGVEEFRNAKGQRFNRVIK